MDELKDKFKSFLKPPKKFKGQGQKLGTAEAKPAPAKPQAHPAAVPATSTSSRVCSRQTPIPSQQQPAAGASSSSGSNPTNLQHSGATAAVNRVEPRQELKPATEFSPFTAVIGELETCCLVPFTISYQVSQELQAQQHNSCKYLPLIQESSARAQTNSNPLKHSSCFATVELDLLCCCAV